LISFCDCGEEFKLDGGFQRFGLMEGGNGLKEQLWGRWSAWLIFVHHRSP
jgi:hypothetical protein